MRCFVAIPLPDDLRAALEAAQLRLRAAAPSADVRWVSASGMHLTLAFLGQVTDERAVAVAVALGTVAARTPPFALECAGLGVFPGPSRPRVIWAGITAGLGDLGALAAGVERALEPLGFAPEKRPFRGHVTLGRARSPRGVAPIARSLEATRFGTWQVAEVVLYQSHLSPKGARYEPLASLRLAGTVA